MTGIEGPQHAEDDDERDREADHQEQARDDDREGGDARDVDRLARDLGQPVGEHRQPQPRGHGGDRDDSPAALGGHHEHHAAQRDGDREGRHEAGERAEPHDAPRGLPAHDVLDVVARAPEHGQAQLQPLEKALPAPPQPAHEEHDAGGQRAADDRRQDGVGDQERDVESRQLQPARRDGHEAPGERPHEQGQAAQGLEQALGDERGDERRIVAVRDPLLDHVELHHVAPARGHHGVEPRAGEVGRDHVSVAQRLGLRIGGAQDVPPAPDPDHLVAVVEQDARDEPPRIDRDGVVQDQAGGVSHHPGDVLDSVDQPSGEGTWQTAQPSPVQTVLVSR